MNEPSPEKQFNRSPLEFLDDEFRQPQRTYGDMMMAFDGYIQFELQVNSTGSQSVMRHMMENGAFPGMDLFAQDYHVGMEQFRAIVWRYFVPLVEGIKSDEELDAWVPNALDVALPRDGRHIPLQCYRFMQGVPGYCLLGSCPVKSIESIIEYDMQSPDFSALEYAINPIKARRNHRRRLVVATRRGIFEPEYAAVLEAEYEDLCEEALGDAA
jgi:hypothetical protein